MNNYHSRECTGVNGEALQLHAVYKKPYFVLQVMRKSVSVPTVPQLLSKSSPDWSACSPTQLRNSEVI